MYHQSYLLLLITSVGSESAVNSALEQDPVLEQRIRIQLLKKLVSKDEIYYDLLCFFYRTFVLEIYF